eukprot:5894123-Karenia_brevis.AAC.1
MSRTEEEIKKVEAEKQDFAHADRANHLMLHTLSDAQRKQICSHVESLELDVDATLSNDLDLYDDVDAIEPRTAS